MNLLQNAHGSQNSDQRRDQVFKDYTSTSDASDGLLGAITSMAVNHNLENSAIGVIEHAPNTILPKMVEINIEFSPIHESTLGWTETGASRNGLFPYGVSLSEKEAKFAGDVYPDSGDNQVQAGIPSDWNTQGDNQATQDSASAIAARAAGTLAASKAGACTEIGGLDGAGTDYSSCMKWKEQAYQEAYESSLRQSAGRRQFEEERSHTHDVNDPRRGN